MKMVQLMMMMMTIMIRMMTIMIRIVMMMIMMMMSGSSGWFKNQKDGNLVNWSTHSQVYGFLM